MRYTYPVLLGAFLCALLISCSGKHSPMEPAVEEPAIQSGQSDVGTQRALWGLWDVYIDPETSSAEIVPIRTASFECNVVNFLQPPISPINSLSIAIDPSGTSFPDGIVSCDVLLKHPFPSSKFCGFDVLGIVMGDWNSVPLQSDSSAELSLPPDTILQNPDGWTRWWNMSEFTTFDTILGYTEGCVAPHAWVCHHTLNPFKYFSDDLGVFDAFDPDPDGRGFFSSSDPGVSIRRYELTFPVNSAGPVFHFKYAVSSSWAPPIIEHPPYYPACFSPEANMPEAYKIAFIDAGSDAYYHSESVYGGDLNFYIEVRDWQLGGNVSSVEDEILTVAVESPTLFSYPLILDLSQAITSPDNSVAIWIPGSIQNASPTAKDNQLLIVSVFSANVTTYEPQIPGITGFDFPTRPLTAFNVFPAPIQDLPPGVDPPVSDPSATSPIEGDSPLLVTLDPSLSYDPDGVIVKYEWDIESNGSYEYSSWTPDLIPHTFETGLYNVGLRCTDDDGISSIGTVIIKSRGQASTWPMYRCTLTREGRTRIPGPTEPTVQSMWQTPYPDDEMKIYGGIAVDRNNNAYFRSCNGDFYSVDPDGVLNWAVDIGTGANCSSSPTVTWDNNVYVGNESGRIFKITLDGSVDWSYASGYGEVDGGFAVMPDDTIIFATEEGFVVKLDPLGNEIWAFYSGNHSIFGGTSVDDEGTIYFADYAGRVWALDQDGNEIWMSDISDNAINCAPALGPFGMYFGDYGGTFYCLDYNGDEIWSTVLCDCLIKNLPAVDVYGHVFVATKDAYFYCLDQITGDIIWDFESSANFNTSGAILDGSNQVYIGNSDGIMYCLTTDGDLVWEFDTGAPIYCKSPAISDDGTLIVGNNDCELWQFHNQ